MVIEVDNNRVEVFIGKAELNIAILVSAGVSNSHNENLRASNRLPSSV